MTACTASLETFAFEKCAKILLVRLAGNVFNSGFCCRRRFPFGADLLVWVAGLDTTLCVWK